MATQPSVVSQESGCFDKLAQPLMSRQSMSVPVYSPFGKEVVRTDGTCLHGVIGSCAPVTESSEVMWVIRSSVWINFVLFIAKMYAFLISGSLAVLASLVDSAIDLIGQGVLWLTKSLASGQAVEDYPVGRGRLEPVGVMICAVVMGMASIEVISSSTMKLLNDWNAKDVAAIPFTPSTALLLVMIILLKAALYVWCERVARRNPSNESVKAISQDNFNDVISNTAALIAPGLTQLGHDWWVADPFAGIAISVYIIYTWLRTGYEQVDMIVGKRADPDFLRKIQSLASEHDPSMTLDQLKAYHFGPRYLVEIEVVMPESTTLRESHDAGIKLQHAIETLEDVERCFVHIDYQLRTCDDHDPEVPIEQKLYGAPIRPSPRAGDSPLAEGFQFDASNGAT